MQRTRGARLHAGSMEILKAGMVTATALALYHSFGVRGVNGKCSSEQAHGIFIVPLPKHGTCKRRSWICVCACQAHCLQFTRCVTLRYQAR